MKNPREIAMLRLLSDGLCALEQQHRQRIEHGESPVDVDREVAQMALNGVVTFLLDHGIESQPLVRLLGALTALSGGSSAPAMLAPVRTRHRRPDGPTIEGIKGRLAAIMEYRQDAGSSRKEASLWVSRHIPPNMKRRLGSATGATIDSWLVKWSGPRGVPAGHGRAGYLNMRAILQKKEPTEPQQKQIIAVLEKHLPSRESK